MPITATTVSCAHCDTPFEKSTSLINVDIARGRSGRYYCSKPCFSAARQKNVSTPCVTCRNIVIRRSADIVESGKVFCNHRCSAKHNNNWVNRKPKPRKHRPCATCGAHVGPEPRKFCPACWQAVVESWGNKPRGSGLSAMRRLHLHAKNVTRHRPRICVRCPYSKHAVVAHIRAVSLFAVTEPLRVVNDPNNLVMLCPNCHWEFDHGEWSLEDLG